MINHYTFFGYILAMAIVLLLSTIAYRFLMESRVNPTFNRRIILIIYGLMILVPLAVICIPESNSGPLIEIGEGRSYPIEEISNTPKDVFNIDILKNWIICTYFIGAGVMVISMLISILRLWMLMKRSEVIEINGREVYLHSNKSLSSFSWNNRIFIFADTLYNSEEDLEILLKHEQAHVDQMHWLDLVLAHLVLIFQWFNPAAWFCQRELQRIHEYEADRYVLSKGTDKNRYQMLLIKNISRNRFSGLTDGLNNCSLKKRLIMMNKIRFKKNLIARVVIVCIFSGVGGFLIHTPAVASVLMESTPEIKSGEAIIVKTDAIDNNDTEEKIAKQNTIILINGKEATEEEMANLDTDKIQSITVKKNEDPAKIIIKTKDGEYVGSITLNQVKTDSDVLPENSQPVVTPSTNSIQVIGYGTQKKSEAKETVVKDKTTMVPASYDGGDSKLIKDVANIVRYPADAYAKEIEGTVVVSFEINANGSTDNFKVLKSVDPSLDEEALRAVKALPGKWIPANDDGNPVASVYELPINFKLE